MVGSCNEAARRTAVRRAQSQERRALILQRAGQVFLEHGFAESSMSRISQAVGGSKGTLYLYFRSKDKLFAEVMVAEIGQRIAVTFSVPEGAGDIEGTLRTIGRRHLAMFSDPAVVALYRSVVHERRRFPEIGRRFMDAGPRTARQRLSRHLAEAVEAGRLPITNVEQAAQQFLALCEGTLVQDLLLDAVEAPNQREIDRQVDVALGAFFAIYPTVAR